MTKETKFGAKGWMLLLSNGDEYVAFDSPDDLLEVYRHCNPGVTVTVVPVLESENANTKRSRVERSVGNRRTRKGKR